MNSPLRFLDGFCGLGGATEGITQAGADVAVEMARLLVAAILRTLSVIQTSSVA